jgi:hypothetical protein
MHHCAKLLFSLHLVVEDLDRDVYDLDESLLFFNVFVRFDFIKLDLYVLFVLLLDLIVATYVYHLENLVLKLSRSLANKLSN